MKKHFLVVVSLICTFFATASAADTPPHDENIYPVCHAHAMIGFDSVINSRLGVPAERALEVTNFHHTSSPAEKSYMLKLIRTMLTAYLWQETPQDYYVQVFEQCLAPGQDQVVG